MSSVQAPQTKQKGPPFDHGRSWWKLWVVYKLLLELPSGKNRQFRKEIRTFHGLKQLGPHLLRRHQCWNTQMLRKKGRMSCCSLILVVVMYPKNPWTLQWKGLNLYRRGPDPQNSHFWGVRILRVWKLTSQKVVIRQFSIYQLIQVECVDFPAGYLSLRDGTAHGTFSLLGEDPQNMEKLVKEPKFMIRKIATLGCFPEVTYKSPSRDLTPATHLYSSFLSTYLGEMT